MSPAASRARALLALGVIAAIVAGVPSLLVLMDAGPVPDVFRSWPRLRLALSTPDDGTLLLALLRVVAWAAWAVLGAALVLEISSRARGIPVPQVRALGLPQGVARALVGAATALFLASQPAQAAAGPQPVSAVIAAAPAVMLEAAPGIRAGVQTGTAMPALPAAGQQSGTSAPAKAPPSTLTHRVRPGDTLWTLAERYLGDGTRFAEIATLNYGRAQPDGATLTDSHWITPGWALLVPQEDPDGGHGGRGHVVAAGESLSGIAQDHLGDADAWPQLFEASRSQVQPDGSRLSDPDHLRPGWTVTIPDPADPSDASPTPDLSDPDQPASTPPTTTESVAPPVSSPAEPASITWGAPAPAEPDDLQDATPWSTRTGQGVGALLAAGIIGTLAGRRRLQGLRRRPGQPALPLPPDDLATTEQTLRAVADPLGVHTVDLVLRTLALHCHRSGTALPVLRAARLMPDRFEIYLEAPSSLPAPWAPAEGTPDGLVWALEPDEAPILEPAELADIPAPYPSLVTLGHDRDDAHFFVDLEYVGVLDLVGPADVVRATMAAMAVELATSSWADDLQVTLVGEFSMLEDSLTTGRIRYLPALGRALEELADRSAQDRAVLAAAGSPELRHARVSELGPSAWTPEILLIATPLTDQQREQLRELCRASPRTAWAAVTVQAGVGPWSLSLPAESGGVAELAPIGLAVRPQVLDDATRGHLQQLFALADPDLAGPGMAADADSPPVGGLVEPSLSELDLVASTDQAADAAPTPGSTTTATPIGTAAPVVRVLGTVVVDGAQGRVETSKRARLTELIAFLALRPGAGHREIDEAIWPYRRHEENLNTRNTATSKARAWLGHSEGGEEFLPRHAAGAGYALSPRVRTDWAIWQDLVGDGVLTAGTDQLEQALALVRGRPFDGVHPRRYAWADTLRQQMSTQIVDVAYELGRRRLLAGRWQAAEAAVVVGLLVEPAWEPLWRLRIMAAHEARNPAAVREAVARMLAITDALGGDLDPATHALLEAMDAAAARGDRVGSEVS